MLTQPGSRRTLQCPKAGRENSGVRVHVRQLATVLCQLVLLLLLIMIQLVKSVVHMCAHVFAALPPPGTSRHVQM